MTKQSRGRGMRPFTLVEVLVVTGIICIIAVLIVVGYNGVYRSWSVRNTVAAMKNVHLVLERFRLENGYLPIESSPVALSYSTSASDPALKTLARDLLQSVHPYAKDFGGTVKVFDDFGSKTESGKVRPLFYLYPYSDTGTFALISLGKDGAWGGDDDIIYLPAGLSGKKLPPGFYLVSLNDDESGVIQSSSDDIEPLVN